MGRVAQERSAPPRHAFHNWPSNPSRVYRDTGWVSWPDWLGSDGTPLNSMLPCNVARVVARKLKLRSMREWQ